MKSSEKKEVKPSLRDRLLIINSWDDTPREGIVDGKSTEILPNGRKATEFKYRRQAFTGVALIGNLMINGPEGRDKIDPKYTAIIQEFNNFVDEFSPKPKFDLEGHRIPNPFAQQERIFPEQVAKLNYIIEGLLNPAKRQAEHEALLRAK